MKRNVAVALGNVGTVDDLPALIAALQENSPLVRQHVVWALGEMARRLKSQDAAQALVEHERIETDPTVRAEFNPD